MRRRTYERYDPAADQWLTMAGGELQTEQYVAAFRAFEAYDAANDAWYQLPHMPIPRHEAAMAAAGNRVHIAGGDVQSAMVPLPPHTGFATTVHDAFEVAG